MNRAPTIEGHTTFLEFIGRSVAVLWKDWPQPMDVTTLESINDELTRNRFTLSGKCPHCLREAVLGMVTAPRIERVRPDPTNTAECLVAAVLQCPGCKKFVLGVVRKPPTKSPGQHNNNDFQYVNHYPMDAPDDSTEDGIPDGIRDDFKEALRCRWVDAYNATVCMCGRALEASCLELGAKGENLEKKIDDLLKAGKITVSLRDMAHRIRLSRNIGAHAPKNEEQEAEKPTKEHADALITFTREYFHFVYTMPSKLKTFEEQAKEAMPSTSQTSELGQ